MLRYGHRSARDFRVTSHCALVARAFGAEQIIICGAQDNDLAKSIEKVTKNWGGTFKTSFSESWQKEIKKYKESGFFAVHLTMFGLPVNKAMPKIRKQKKVLIIIGSQKVERNVYEHADANVSITLQPHSEISALAVFLDRFFDGNFMTKKFPQSKIHLKPQLKGKGVLSNTD